MISLSKIESIQHHLREQQIDGWLLYDHNGSNRFVRDLLFIPKDLILTRRFFYWIPQVGHPVKILHHIEAKTLENLPGNVIAYLSWKELEIAFQEIFRSSFKRIAMEYSPRSSNPYVSMLDAGTYELIKDYVQEIVSSENLLLYFTSVLDERQIISHIEAAAILKETTEKTWEWISSRLKSGKKITEYDVQQFILSELLANQCITEDGPICAINQNSSLPHYIAQKHSCLTIEPGDFILIDLWAKRDVSYGVYADITRCAVAASEPTPLQEHIFSIVREAQKKATDFVINHMQNSSIKGFEVDQICREHIEKSGYGQFFHHRTGHSIDTQVIGAGTHLDNLEFCDHRPLLPGTCFSIEPGIYLPNEFGLRLEYDLLIHHDRTVEVTGGIVETLQRLL